MISTIDNNTEVKQVPMSFPKLMKSKSFDRIVLFTNDCTGIEVSGNDLGYFSDNWDICCFKELPLDTRVILQN